MAQHYSDESRADDPHALPDVETFRANYAYCPDCQSLVYADHFTADDGSLRGRCECGQTPELTQRGWFYWFCLPGCLPDSEPFGPYKTEQDAVDDAKDFAQ